jgi:hypothetical protein
MHPKKAPAAVSPLVRLPPPAPAKPVEPPKLQIPALADASSSLLEPAARTHPTVAVAPSSPF